MEEWKEYKLGELIILNSGGTPDKNNKSYWGGEIPWISAKYMNEEYLYSSGLSITKEGLINGSRLATKGSILLLTRGSGLFNRIPVCYVMRDLAFNQDVKCIETKHNEIVSTKFLFYWLIAHRDSISSILETTGIGAGKIDTKRLKEIRITLPPKGYQQFLINFAESLMYKIEINRRINENLEQQAQALFKSWFVDFEPFKNGEFVESELGMIPKGWKVGTLDDIADFSKDKIRTNDLNTDSYYSTENMLPQKGGVTKAANLPNVEYITSCKPGDIIVSNIRPSFNKIYYCDREIAGCSPDVLCFVPKRRRDSVFLYSILFDDKFFEYMVMGTKGTKMPRGDKQQIMKYKIIRPDDVTLQRYSNIVLPMTKSIKNRNNQSRRLAQLRDTLLPRLMSGEIKVGDLPLNN